MDEKRATSLRDDIQLDIADRAEWRERQRQKKVLRLGVRRRKSQPYPGSPNLTEPLIDDNVVSLTSAENTILWSARLLAVFLPLDTQAYQYKRDAERAFDTMLRITLNVRAKVENLFDTKNERGFGVAKMTVNTTAVPDSVLPDFETIDPRDVVVPTATRFMQEAERICHINRYTERVFDTQAKLHGWENAKEVKDYLLSNREGANSSGQGEAGAGQSANNVVQDDEMYGTSRSEWGIKDGENSHKEIVIWETYNWQKKDGEYRKYKTVMCPDCPQYILKNSPWQWAPTVEPQEIQDPITGEVIVVPTEVEGLDRSWPFVQPRYENRTLNYYDSRGVTDKLESDQKEATAYKRAQAQMLDYTAKPFLKGNPAVLKTFRWRAGDILPADAEFVIPPRVDPIFEYNLDTTRAIAARRVGAPLGALSNTENKGNPKTATEVSQTAVTHQMLSSDAVDRFAEPMGELWNMMWEWLQHNPPDGGMPAVSGENIRILDPAAFQQKFLIIPGVSSKSSHPELLLRQIMAIGQAVQAFPQAGQFFKGAEMAEFLMELIDPKLAPILVVDPQSPSSPIEQTVMQLMQMLTGTPGGQGQPAQPGLAQQVAGNTEYLTSIAQDEEAAQEQAKIAGRAPADYTEGPK